MMATAYVVRAYIRSGSRATAASSNEALLCLVRARSNPLNCVSTHRSMQTKRFCAAIMVFISHAVWTKAIANALSFGEIGGRNSPTAAKRRTFASPRYVAKRRRTVARTVRWSLWLPYGDCVEPRARPVRGMFRLALR